MKAIVLTANKAALQLNEVELAPLIEGQVRVKIHAAAFNRRDYWIQQGQYAGLKYPVILGSDGAGVVVAGEGEEAAAWIGKSVIINPGQNWGDNPRAQGKAFHILGLPQDGTFAEYVQIAASALYEMPSHLTYTQAAALPLAGVTAYRALCTRAQVQKGDKVLITGIGGGVAVLALQFAVALGAEVWVTSSKEEKIQAAVVLGAKGGISYKEENWGKTLVSQAGGGFDVIIDSAGGEAFATLVDIAASGGRIAFFGGTLGNFPPLSPQKIFWKQLSILGSTMGTQSDFAQMVDCVKKYQIVPVVDSVFPLSDAETAIQKMANSTQMGKIVLEVCE